MNNFKTITDFIAEHFTATQWDTAEKKAAFAKQFIKFVQSDFAKSKFPKTFYVRLSMTFGHIAHYNQHGFYEEFFTTTQDKVRFLHQTMQHPCYGDPAWTYSDVEKTLQIWLRENDVLAEYEQRLAEESETEERAILSRLHAKYGTTNCTKKAMSKNIDWADIESAAKQLAGNWQRFTCFAWSRGYELEDADQWAIFYTSGRDAGLLDQSNHDQIAKGLALFMEADDPDVVFESHSHWAVGYLDGFSIRVYGKDGGITQAFKEFCAIKAKLDDYPILNEEDYSEREYEATLENYRSEMWAIEKQLPAGWESEVYSWFGDNGQDRCTENRDDQGGYAPKESIMKALQELGLMPTVVIEGSTT